MWSPTSLPVNVLQRCTSHPHPPTHAHTHTPIHTHTYTHTHTHTHVRIIWALTIFFVTIDSLESLRTLNAPKSTLFLLLIPYILFFFSFGGGVSSEKDDKSLLLTLQFPPRGRKVAWRRLLKFDLQRVEGVEKIERFAKLTLSLLIPPPPLRGTQNVLSGRRLMHAMQ